LTLFAPGVALSMPAPAPPNGIVTASHVFRERPGACSPRGMISVFTGLARWSFGLTLLSMAACATPLEEDRVGEASSAIADGRAGAPECEGGSAVRAAAAIDILSHEAPVDACDCVAFVRDPERRPEVLRASLGSRNAVERCCAQVAFAATPSTAEHFADGEPPGLKERRRDDFSSCYAAAASAAATRRRPIPFAPICNPFAARGPKAPPGSPTLADGTRCERIEPRQP